MKEFNVGDSVYITSSKADEESLLDPIDTDMETVIQGTVCGKHIDMWPISERITVYYEIREWWDEDYTRRRNPEDIYSTEEEAKQAIEKDLRDRIEEKKRAYAILKKQLQELGEEV